MSEQAWDFVFLLLLVYLITIHAMNVALYLHSKITRNGKYGLDLWVIVFPVLIAATIGFLMQ